MPDNYHYDVFVSYPRCGSFKWWVPDVLVPLLQENLEDAGFPNPRFFVDARELRPGVDWPEDLAAAHHHSRVILPVLGAPYFRSGWCTSEWVNAFAREEQERARGGRPARIVVPLRFNDLEEEHVERLEDPVRDQVKKRSRGDVYPFTAVVNPRADTETAHKLRQTIRQFCEESLLHALEAAPPWRPDWPRLPTKPVLGNDPSWRGGM